MQPVKVIVATSVPPGQAAAAPFAHRSAEAQDRVTKSHEALG